MGLFSKIKKGIKKATAKVSGSFGKIAKGAMGKVGGALLKKATDFGKAAITSATGGIISGDDVMGALSGGGGGGGGSAPPPAIAPGPERAAPSASPFVPSWVNNLPWFRQLLGK